MSVLELILGMLCVPGQGQAGQRPVGVPGASSFSRMARDRRVADLGMAIGQLRILSSELPIMEKLRRLKRGKTGKPVSG